MSLNGVKAKLSDPANFQDVLVGVRLFNKDSKYYPIYARTFVSKSVKYSAEDDSRVVVIKEAAEVISTLQELLDGHEGLTGEAAAKEAVARVGKAQNLIGQFLSASGVEDEKIAAYVAAH